MPDGDDAGWVPVEGVGEPDEMLELRELDLLSEATHPVRSRIVRALRHPRTAADLAELLDVPVTRLYHHINRLEELGFIRVVATRKVAAVTERRYQVVAKGLHIDKRLFESSDRRELAQALGSLFDVTKLSFQREVEHGLLGDPADPDTSILSRGQIFLSPARVTELHERMKAMIDDFTSDAEEDDPDGQRLEVFIAVFPSSP